MSNFSPVTLSVDSEGIAWITFDDPSARANIFNPATFAALRAAVDGLAAASTPVKAVVFISAKERIFIAGADLKWIAALPDEEAAMRASQEGQALFNVIADLKVPVVCAIHGACAGGGYELALACTWRIASDSPATRIGLPEVSLGLIPGWGGCTRLTQLIGVKSAAEFILSATLVPAAVAMGMGLVDELVPAAELKARAKAAALRLATGGAATRAAPPLPAPDFFPGQRALVKTRFRGQPAPLAVLDSIEKSQGFPRMAALDEEARGFARVAAGEAAKNLIRLFLLKEKARKATLDPWYVTTPAESGAPKPFRTIGIVGAGVMGSGIAHWCAAHEYGVILCDEKKSAIEHGVTVIRRLFADGVKRGLLTGDVAHRMMGGIGITTSLEDFEYCDLVIEAIAENASEKQKLFAELSKSVRPDCVLASTSSVLTIEEIASHVVNPGRVLGIHFFNPVGHVPLVELAFSSQTTRATADRALAWVAAIGKTPVICRSSSGLFVMRVLSFYLNAACRLCEQDVPPASIDDAMSEWGWTMGPLRLMDEIGLEETVNIFAEMQRHFPDRFSGSLLCGRMLADGLEGRKNGTGAGFYIHSEDQESLNPALGKYLAGSSSAPLQWTGKAIQDHLHGALIEEANRALAEKVISTSDDTDLALLLGLGFPAFRGGLRTAGFNQ